MRVLLAGCTMRVYSLVGSCHAIIQNNGMHDFPDACMITAASCTKTVQRRGQSILRSCHQSWRCCLIHLFFHLYPQCDSIISRDRGVAPCWPQGQRRRATPALINGLQPLVLSLIFCLDSFGRISLWDWRWWIKQIFQLLQVLLHFDQQGVASCKLGSNFDAGRLQLYQHVTRRHGNETQTLLWASGCWDTESYRSAHMFGSSQAMGHDCLHGNDCMWIQHYTASCMFSTPFVK